MTWHEWLQPIRFVLPDGLRLSEAIVRELIFDFDAGRIYMDSSGKSGWWNGVTLHGIPSSHIVHDESGLHLRGTDMNDARSNYCMNISQDYRAVEVDIESGLCIVAPLFGEWQVPYTVDLGIDGIIYKEEAKEMQDRIRRVSQMHSPLPGVMSVDVKECRPNEHEYRYVTCRGWREKEGFAETVSSNGALCIRCGQFRDDLYYDSRKNQWVKPF